MADLLKRKLKTTIIDEQYKILKEIDRRSSCAAVAQNDNIPKQTLSHWVKDKQKIYGLQNQILQQRNAPNDNKLINMYYH